MGCAFLSAQFGPSVAVMLNLKRAGGKNCPVIRALKNNRRDASREGSLESFMRL
jgi:hypothetical protein